MTTTQTFDPKTSGAIYARRHNVPQFTIIATDVVIERDGTISYNSVSRVYVERGHTEPRRNPRRESRWNARGYTFEFVSVEQDQSLSKEFGSLYEFPDYFRSNCE